MLKIVIRGASATPPDSFNGFDGFDVEAGPTTIRGLVINGFQESTNGNGGQAIGFFNLAVNTNTNANGNASFSMVGPAVDQGDAITATARGADGTSEFSDPEPVAAAS